MSLRVILVIALLSQSFVFAEDHRSGVGASSRRPAEPEFHSNFLRGYFVVSDLEKPETKELPQGVRLYRDPQLNSPVLDIFDVKGVKSRIALTTYENRLGSTSQTGRIRSSTDSLLLWESDYNTAMSIDDYLQVTFRVQLLKTEQGTELFISELRTSTHYTAGKPKVEKTKKVIAHYLLKASN